MQIASSSFREWKGLTGQIILLVLDQKIPDWLVKIMCLGAVETAIRSGVQCRFGIMGF